MILGRRGCAGMHAEIDHDPFCRLERIRPAFTRLSATIGEALIPSLRDAADSIARLILGPKAPPRKRPRRVAKKIEARRWRLRYPKI